MAMRLKLDARKKPSTAYREHRPSENQRCFHSNAVPAPLRSNTPYCVLFLIITLSFYKSLARRPAMIFKFQFSERSGPAVSLIFSLIIVAFHTKMTTHCCYGNLSCFQKSATGSTMTKAWWSHHSSSLGPEFYFRLFFKFVRYIKFG